MRIIKLPNGGEAHHPPFTKAEQRELMRQIGPPTMVAWPRGAGALVLKLLGPPQSSNPGDDVSAPADPAEAAVSQKKAGRPAVG